MFDGCAQVIRISRKGGPKEDGGDPEPCYAIPRKRARLRAMHPDAQEEHWRGKEIENCHVLGIQRLLPPIDEDGIRQGPTDRHKGLEGHDNEQPEHVVHQLVGLRIPVGAERAHAQYHGRQAEGEDVCRSRCELHGWQHPRDAGDATHLRGDDGRVGDEEHARDQHQDGSNVHAELVADVMVFDLFGCPCRRQGREEARSDESPKEEQAREQARGCADVFEVLQIEAVAEPGEPVIEVVVHGLEDTHVPVEGDLAKSR